MLHGPPTVPATQPTTESMESMDQGAGPGDDAMSGDNFVCQLQDRVELLLKENDVLNRANRDLEKEVGELRRQIRDWKITIANLIEEYTLGRQIAPNDMANDVYIYGLAHTIDVLREERDDFAQQLAHLRNHELAQLEQEIEDLRKIRYDLVEENTGLIDTNEKWEDLIDVLKTERRDILFEQFDKEFVHARNCAMHQELVRRGIGEFFVWPPPPTQPPGWTANRSASAASGASGSDDPHPVPVAQPPPRAGPPPGVDPMAAIPEEATVPMSADQPPPPVSPRPVGGYSLGPPAPPCVEVVAAQQRPVVPAVERLFDPHRTGPPDGKHLSWPPFNSQGVLLPPPLSGAEEIPMAIAGGICLQWTTSAGALMPIAGGTQLAAAEAAGLASYNGPLPDQDDVVPWPPQTQADVQAAAATSIQILREQPDCQPEQMQELLELRDAALRVERHQPNERRALPGHFEPPWEQPPHWEPISGPTEPLVEPPPELEAEDRECYFRCGRARHSDGVSMGFGGFCCWSCRHGERDANGLIKHGRLCGNKPWKPGRRR